MKTVLKMMNDGSRACVFERVERSSDSFRVLKGSSQFRNASGSVDGGCTIKKNDKEVTSILWQCKHSYNVGEKMTVRNDKLDMQCTYINKQMFT